MVITLWEPPRRCEVLHTGRVVQGTGVFEVLELPGDRARLVWSEQLVLPLGVVGRLGFPVVAPAFKAGVAASLKKLARAVEAEHAAGDWAPGGLTWSSVADGLSRCGWGASTPDYVTYHDEEWGRPVHGDDRLFERLTLEAFQSGLSWLTILRKRESFRAAFAGFSIPAVAAFDDERRRPPDGRPGIVRNRAKVAATLTNARAAAALLDAEGEGALDRLIWSYAPADRPRTAPAHADLPAQTDGVEGAGEGLKSRGFVFVGPTTMYAGMQACGLVDDHLVGCHRSAR